LWTCSVQFLVDGHNNYLIDSACDNDCMNVDIFLRVIIFRIEYVTEACNFTAIQYKLPILYDWAVILKMAVQEKYTNS